jgi:hypothetical protein
MPNPSNERFVRIDLRGVNVPREVYLYLVQDLKYKRHEVAEMIKALGLGEIYRITKYKEYESTTPSANKK